MTARHMKHDIQPNIFQAIGKLQTLIFNDHFDYMHCTALKKISNIAFASMSIKCCFLYLQSLVVKKPDGF